MEFIYYCARTVDIIVLKHGQCRIRIKIIMQMTLKQSQGHDVNIKQDGKKNFISALYGAIKQVSVT